jgi:hypothetical protein
LNNFAHSKAHDAHWQGHVPSLPEDLKNPRLSAMGLIKIHSYAHSMTSPFISSRPPPPGGGERYAALLNFKITGFVGGWMENSRWKK